MSYVFFFFGGQIVTDNRDYCLKKGREKKKTLYRRTMNEYSIASGMPI